MTFERTPARTGGLSTGDVVDALVGADAPRPEWQACEQALHRWRMSGAVTPSVTGASGQGSRVRWSTGDLWRLRRIWGLREQMRRYDMRLSQPMVSEVWASLYEGRPTPLERPAGELANA